MQRITFIALFLSLFIYIEAAVHQTKMPFYAISKI